MDSADARAALDRHLRAQGETYAGLSRVLDRNPTYVQQYVRRGVPRALETADLRALAKHLGIAAALIGEAEDAPQPVAVVASDATTPTDFVRVPTLEAHAAPFGLAFHASWIGDLASTRVDALAMLRVEGDAMLPTLVPDDHLLIDTADDAARLRDGLYALRLEGALMVKRLAVNPATRQVRVASDNDTYPAWEKLEPSSLAIVGRVVWAGRSFL